MRFLILLCIFIIGVNTSYADVIVNEIMYDPIQNENYNEWLELYNNGTKEEDISNLTICGERLLSGYVNRSGSVFLDISMIMKADEYAIISDGSSGTEVYDNFNISNESIAFRIDSSSICGGLSNNGNEIILYFQNKNSSINYTDNVNEGYSLELINESFIQSNEVGGTPGKKNTANASQANNSENNSSNDSNQTNSSGELGISIGISSNNLSLEEELIFFGNITTTFISEKNASLTIKIAKNISGSWSYKWYVLENENFSIENNETINDALQKNVSWIIPDDFIIGNYKILATLEYYEDNSSKHRYSDQIFYINGLENLGEYNLTITESPISMNFGGISKVIVKINTNNYNLKNASFVAYIYEPRWASIDLNDDTLMTRPYDTNVALKFNNLSRGSVNYVAIPIFTKRNCDNEYDDGTYKAKVKVYDNDESILEQTFELQLSGRNEEMCPKAETKYITKASTDSSKNLNEEVSIDSTDSTITDYKEYKFTYDNINFELTIPKIVKGGNIEVKVNSKNPNNESKTFEVWSYLYLDNKLVFERYENKIKKTLEPDKEELFKLINPLPEKFKEGEYKLLLKINSSNRKTEKSISQTILVLNNDSQKANDIPKITNFYIKGKKYDKEITLISGCNNSNNQSNYNLTLYSFDIYQIKECNKTIEFIVELKEGNNLFFLSIDNNETSYDTKKMLIKLNNTKIESFSESMTIYDNLNSRNPLDEIYGKNLLTGYSIKNDGVIYESSNEKVKKLIKYILPTVFVIGIALFMRRKNG